MRIERVTKQFGGFQAVNNLSLDILEGEFFALLGPSGCGKTTLLRMLAGFEPPDEGRILLDGKDIGGLPPYLRPVNMMFQSYALFPHLSVEQNIAFGLKREGMPRPDIAARVAEMLALVRLEGLEARKPAQLSGGQKQRVALARALAKRPRLLLLDEPLAALDKKLREETQLELIDLQKRLGLTFLVVTHDQQEAMSLSNRIGVMNRGELAQVGAPRQVYEQPDSRYVAEFIGNINMFEAHVESMRETEVRLKCGALTNARVAHGALAGFAVGEKVVIAVRPERLICTGTDAADPSLENRAAGSVTDATYLGETTVLYVKLDSGETIRISQSSRNHAEAAPARGQRVNISFPANAACILKY